MNEKNNAIRNLRSELENESVDINTLLDKNGDIFCDRDHNKDSKIREGNKFYMVVVGKENDWKIECLRCLNCNIKDTFNRLQPNKHRYIAVVESKMKTKNLNTNEKELFDLNVWELTEVDKSINS
jgi:hypothetical protein